MAAIHPYSIESIQSRGSFTQTFKHLERLSYILDNSLRVPGTQRRIGLDSIVGLIPGLGDAVGVMFSAYLIIRAARMGVPVGTLLRMSSNVGIDAILGTVPVLGDLFDMGWKANSRNITILGEQLASNQRLQARPWRKVARLAATPLAVLFTFIVALTFFGVAVIAHLLVN